MITESAKNVVIVIYIPEKSPDAVAESAMKRLGERLTAFAGASAVNSAICRP
jgi:DNA/RNA-binding domain of Phe-tRNA-synthetase-like protein